MSGVVVWFTGLPASGKSTLARSVSEALADTPHAMLDGDDVRRALVPAPGYEPAARDAFYSTLANLAALLAGQGLVVLVPATANLRRFRAAARELAPAFIEVFVDTAVEECRRRDPKGLYADAAEGGSTLPGVGASYEAPAAPDVVAHGGAQESVIADIVERIRKCCANEVSS